MQPKADGYGKKMITYWISDQYRGDKHELSHIDETVKDTHIASNPHLACAHVKQQFMKDVSKGAFKVQSKDSDIFTIIAEKDSLYESMIEAFDKLEEQLSIRERCDQGDCLGNISDSAALVQPHTKADATPMGIHFALLLPVTALFFSRKCLKSFRRDGSVKPSEKE